MPEPTYIQTLAAAVQFDGLTESTGLLALDDPGECQRAKIVSASWYSAAPIPTARLEAFDPNPPGGVATRIIIVKDWTAGVAYGDPVLPEEAIPQGWQLRFITAGKTAEATVIIDFVPAMPLESF